MTEKTHINIRDTREFDPTINEIGLLLQKYTIPEALGILRCVEWEILCLNEDTQ